MPTVRLFAAAAEAAGVDDLDLPAGSYEELVATLGATYGAQMAAVVRQCAILMDGVRCGPGDIFPADATVDVLPPFAGG